LTETGSAEAVDRNRIYLKTVLSENRNIDLKIHTGFIRKMHRKRIEKWSEKGLKNRLSA